MEKKYEVRAEIRIELTQENIDDIMVTALEGGITYWCSEASPECGELLKEYPSEQISRGGALLLYDFEEEAYRRLDLEKFLKGFKLWVENGGDEYGAIEDGKVDCCNIDADCADAIIQYALFGEVIYG
ncbi:MAG: hypothetical protein KH446_03145 [Oscillibacter sp.]|jgi:hypothetical protein|uniref:hypothetical protein n=1 Tax=Oscillibacter sp. TaxID=1945593 RepID=UPI001D5BDE45|nr:hypothetical protein [Oscillibacter sp.]MBS6290693.1 hypothetical protein [Oscillibacter sp.]